MTRPRRHRWLLPTLATVLLAVAALLFVLVEADTHQYRFDAQYVGSETCGQCHTLTYDAWRHSPHRNMVRKATRESVVANFDDYLWKEPGSGQAAVRFHHDGDDYFVSLRHPEEDRFVDFPVEYVVGYQYRQVFLTREPGGVLRRLPLTWSTATDDYFPYWNVQEGSEPTVADFWDQMKASNSAWNLFCARCHTTNLEIHRKDEAHTMAEVSWTETGIACEACHGPGSLHVRYMRSSPVNRLANFITNKLQGERVAYIASAASLPKAQALSVCGRCHGADIFAQKQDLYREFEPGYSRTGRINDLSAYFREVPLTPGRENPTVEVYHNGRPRGIGMLFRSFVESSCYAGADVRCQDCHDPHNNKLPTMPGILAASAQSNAYCMDCHSGAIPDVVAHTRHEEGEPGSFCYDCHMPRHIYKLARGVPEFTRTHDMSSLPNPSDSVRFGEERAPNACTSCHEDRDPGWAAEMLRSWGS